METTTLDPAPLMRLGMAFTASRVLLSAVELDLFTALDTPKTAAEIRDKLCLHPRAVPDFTDALVALKVIERDGDGPDALYKNSPSSAAFLSKSSPTYQGGMFLMCAKRLYKYWSHLTEGLQSGQPQNESHPRYKNATNLWDFLGGAPGETESFVDAMAASNTKAHQVLAERFDFNRYGTLLDCGGASAQLACEIVLKHPKMKAVSMDLMAVTQIAKKNIIKHNLEDKVEAIVGNIWDGNYRKSDVILMGMILHDYDLEKKKLLIKNAYDSLPENGAFIAIDMVIDDERRVNAPGLLMSLNMLIELGSAFDYTFADFKSWVTEIGFRKAELMPLVHSTSACIAYK